MHGTGQRADPYTFFPLAPTVTLCHRYGSMWYSTSKAKPVGVVTRVLLVALLLRAYVPVGFMPASGTPFLLELCPAAFSVPSEHAHHHPGDHGHFENCPFGSAPAAGPISQVVEFSPPVSISSSVVVADQPPRLPVGRLSIHQPRGPPSLV